MKIAVHQMCSDIHPETNLDNILHSIAEAARNDAGFYFAPEMSVLLDRDGKRSALHIDNDLENIAIKTFCQAAKEHQIWVHIGSIPVQSGNERKRLNRSYVISSRGEVIAKYDKMHLFDVDLSNGESWRESNIYDAGQEVVLAKTPLGMMGLSICYDLRFSELFAALNKAGADILTVPAAFTVATGRAHWEILLRARAIESASFVIAAAQVGHHADGRETYGHSLVLDPWGEILLDMQDQQGIGYVDIDLGRLNDVRRQVPVRQNRRAISEARVFS